MRIVQDLLATLRHRLRGTVLLSLVTVPATIALILTAAAVAVLIVESETTRRGETLWPVLIPYDTAVAFLGTVASASITALSLAYSLVLVVFTLAAGNIGPRLLRRFTEDRTNQVTAGLFGGTFLFALTIMYAATPDFVPQLGIGLAGLLAILSVAQLIYFVQQVSASVTIDEEIAKISASLEDGLKELLEDAAEAAERVPPQAVPRRVSALAAPASGYIGDIDRLGLLAIATRDDLRIWIAARQGRFVVAGQPLVYHSGKIDDEVAEEILARVGLEPSRSSRQFVEFSIHLLVEIALRALSPGVNDTFTAIACVDRISAALVEPARRGLAGETVLFDEDNHRRVFIPGMSASDLIGTAFHPLRRASETNILMSRCLADALVRLSYVAVPEVREELARHAKLLVEELETGRHQPVDVEHVTAKLSPLLALDEKNKPTGKRGKAPPKKASGGAKRS